MATEGGHECAMGWLLTLAKHTSRVLKRTSRGALGDPIVSSEENVPPFFGRIFSS